MPLTAVLPPMCGFMPAKNFTFAGGRVAFVLQGVTAPQLAVVKAKVA